MIDGFWITQEIQWYFPLTPATLNKSPPSAVKRVLEGQANADTVQCFYWPNEKPLCVSRGSALRLGSLLSAFISVSFAIPLSRSLFLSPSLSLSYSFSLSLTPPFSNSLTPSLLLFSPEEPEKKMSPDQISGSLQHCLSASVCLFHQVIASLMKVSRSLFVPKLLPNLPQVWYSMTVVMQPFLTANYFFYHIVFTQDNKDTPKGTYIVHACSFLFDLSLFRFTWTSCHAEECYWRWFVGWLKE